MHLDSNIVIAYLAGEADIVSFLEIWRTKGGNVFISAIAQAEVLSFSGWSLTERSQVEQFLEDNFTFLPFHNELARLTGRLRSTVSIKLPDAGIAATALYARNPLITRNLKDFRKVQGLQIVSL